MKVLRKILFSHITVIAIAFVLQMLFILNMLLWLEDYSSWFYGASTVLSLLIVMLIIYSDKNPAYKLAWTIPILLVPVFGGIFYLAFGGNNFSRKERRRMRWVDEITGKSLTHQDDLIEAMADEDRSAGHQSVYIQNSASFPPYRNGHAEYYKIGEDMYEALLRELKQAESFIFMEYFIIEEGKMWNSILEVLEQKASEGVDVRLMYDDFGCLFTLPFRYWKRMEAKGIKCLTFNPLVPVLSAKFNTRDHRKITVIDGKTAFTGGINLADEYINEFEKYGHWKDMGLMIKGQGVWNFTVMFLSLWDALKEQDTDFTEFKAPEAVFENMTGKGYVQPYSDTPLDNEAVGQNVYLNMINRAQDYVYITTPYLIIDNEMSTALCNAAKSGVDVRIITPHKPDKWYAHETSRSFYPKLVNSGVRIYEYTPGFIHGKNYVSDDKYAVVGTINMDFRSLFLHFECGTWMYGTETVMDVKKDFLETLEICQEVTSDNFKNVGLPRRLVTLVLRLFAPLL